MIEPEVGDKIRCNPAKYEGGSPSYTEWHTIVKMDSSTYYIKGPAFPLTPGEWTRHYDHFEFILGTYSQQVI